MRIMCDNTSLQVLLILNSDDKTQANLILTRVANLQSLQYNNSAH